MYIDQASRLSRLVSQSCGLLLQLPKLCKGGRRVATNFEQRRAVDGMPHRIETITSWRSGTPRAIQPGLTAKKGVWGVVA